ncbi:MAG: phosphonate metabolism protein/1,5-bisphosphokinase (PRPP-forming) PhnN [Gammaproteobacteria bacterium]|nr:phosphonate metabolism protein/1,5-bisphosphokinase (PRPP-forming) PhnN [Rhodocyclaceae bacterium]MBU3908801.1 phosphonate metabolism protein/1,5-bisphosphokinase (PRPP-forming) PhnN [Gammaproteobacteria bacterium]MBU3988410.1 phosphonate metabolism protein/1,5-bisphosphokinase (PRPP-forming) PhnN [Gammaproteobacteria bacterium]MBU4004829.1 phosphonate metabolism protein/1,5-bisphosphokinase (PRPP-forming) PhnN [Gammaproteobacteria bacterium]MBU4021432.1 phosphonate metabolism protein/1,5-bi
MTGCLIFVVGPSGVGKDSLLAHARSSLENNQDFRFVRRHITRPATAGGEDHHALSRDEFADRLAAERFALHWDSHGLRYGIDREIDAWLRAGYTVVLNGSREHLPVARQCYPGMRVIAITASPAALAQRLAQRRRESTDEIIARIAHQPPLPEGLPVIEISNDDSLVAAGHALVDALQTHRQAVTEG